MSAYGKLQKVPFAGLLRPFRFPTRPACPRVNSPSNGGQFSPGDTISVNIDTNRADLDHSIELIDMSGTVVAGPVVIAAGGTSGSLDIPAAPNESKQFYVRVFVGSAGHFEHRVLVETFVPLTVTIATTSGPMQGEHEPPQTVTLEATPAGGGKPYAFQWRLNNADLGGGTGQQLTRTMTNPGTYAFTVVVVETGHDQEAESDPLEYTLKSPFEIVDFRRDPPDDTVPVGTAVTFFLTLAGGTPPYNCSFVIDGNEMIVTTSSTEEFPLGTHMFNTPGAWEGLLTATDADAASHTRTTTVEVTP